MNPKDLVGAKKAPLRYVPPALMLEVAPIMENGAMKYGPFNWREQPVSAVTYVEAVQRHLFAWLDGQENAEDSGLPHLAHAAASLGILLDAIANKTLLDDRGHPGPAPDILRRLDKSAKPEPPLVQKEPWGTGDGPVYGMERGEWNAYGLTVPKASESAPPRFLCGHLFGDEPNEGCGTAVHWSRVNGIELKDPPLNLDCNCKTDWSEHSFDCPLFHVGRS